MSASPNSSASPKRTQPFPPLFNAPLFDLFQFGKQCATNTRRLPPITTYHLIRLAEMLSRDMGMFIRAAKRLPDKAPILHHYGRSLLSDQLESVVWHERYLWVIRGSPTDFRDVRRDVRDTIADSLLATACQHLRVVPARSEESTYLRSWINVGLQWCMVCVEHEGSINLYTKLPELDVAAINSALDQDG